MRVYLFQPRFHPLIRTGEKTTTIRAMDKRGWEFCQRAKGQPVSLRGWRGKPRQRGSRQFELLQSRIVLVSRVRITIQGATILNGDGSPAALTVDSDVLAERDGFRDYDDLLSWFLPVHSLPFGGVLYGWEPPTTNAQQPSTERSDR